jgi:hypothetical protein
MSCFAHHSPSHLSTYKAIVVQSSGRSFIGGGSSLLREGEWVASLDFFMSSSFDIFISRAFEDNHEVFFSLTKSKLNFYLLRSRFKKPRSLPCRRLLQPTQASGGGCCHFVCTQWLFHKDYTIAAILSLCL